MARKLKKNRGMKLRNRVRLRQFDNPFNEAALLRLPAELFRLARQQDTGGEASLNFAMYAIAIELLTVHAGAPPALLLSNLSIAIQCWALLLQHGENEEPRCSSPRGSESLSSDIRHQAGRSCGLIPLSISSMCAEANEQLLSPSV